MGDLLKISHLSRFYPGVAAVKDVSFTLQKGDIVALTGNNGAGKSTLFNLIAGLEKPDAGSIVFDGKDLTAYPFQARARLGLALYFQRPRLFRNETCRDNLIVSRHGHPGETFAGILFKGQPGRVFEAETRKKAIEWLRFIGMEDKADTRAGTLSGGQQKLLYLSMLLINDPKLLLLDEPFANVSATMLPEIGRKLREVAAAGKTLLIIEHHIPELIAISNRMLNMNKGALVEISVNPTHAER